MKAHPLRGPQPPTGLYWTGFTARCLLQYPCLAFIDTLLTHLFLRAFPPQRDGRPINQCGFLLQLSDSLHRNTATTVLHHMVSKDTANWRQMFRICRYNATQMIFWKPLVSLNFTPKKLGNFIAHALILILIYLYLFFIVRAFSSNTLI